MIKEEYPEYHDQRSKFFDEMQVNETMYEEYMSHVEARGTMCQEGIIHKGKKRRAGSTRNVTQSSLI